jgi:hypothetical protein
MLYPVRCQIRDDFQAPRSQTRRRTHRYVEEDGDEATPKAPEYGSANKLLYNCFSTRFNRMELSTTETDEKAMARPAYSGLRVMP